MKIQELYENDIPCSYYDSGKMSDIRYRYIEDCSSDEYELMLERGWRRFGNLFFVPVCKSCSECVTPKIDSFNFKLTKSFKRVKKRNSDISFVIQKPTLLLEHIELHNNYHRFMTQKKDWIFNEIDEEDYYKSFVQGSNDYGYEILYKLGDELVGVAFVDILENSLSCVYFFYNHKFQDRSLGVYSILLQLELAKKLKIRDVYLGYWIKNHYSMGYKERFAPFDILVNRAELDEETIWKEYKK
jgi:arginine-tRNA-protein transferase